MKPLFLTDYDIYRILRDLLSSELKRMRGPGEDTVFFSQDSVFKEAPWQLDSLEIMELTAAVNEFFHLHKTGLEDNLLRCKSMNRWIEIISLSWQENQEEITFRTSGSTGKPAPYIHSTESLMQEIIEIAEMVEHGKRIISFVPAHHIYGFLFTIMLPAYTGIKVMDARDTGIGSLSHKFEPGDLLISFPAHWSYLERSISCWPENIRGISSTGPANPDLLQRLCKKGLAGITEIYGSSEHGSIGFRQKPDHPYRIFSYLQRSESKTNGEYLLSRTLPDGKQKSFNPDDLLQWENENEFQILQRRDGAVQIGGINVFPEKTASTIKKHPMVADCVVRLMKKSENPRLKAFIVPVCDNANESFRDEIRSWIRKHLSAHERPVNLSFGKEIPKNDMGKHRDWD